MNQTCLLTFPKYLTLSDVTSSFMLLEKLSFVSVPLFKPELSVYVAELIT